MEGQSCVDIISGKISTCSITDHAIPEEESSSPKKKLVGEEVIGKRIRIFYEGCVVLVDDVNVFYKYAFERDDNGRLEILHLKDQMIESGIIEKEEDMIGKRIRVYDEGVVTYFYENLGMHIVAFDDGTEKLLRLHDQEYLDWEWEWEWDLGKSQLAAVKRIWKINEDRSAWE